MRGNREYVLILSWDGGRTGRKDAWLIPLTKSAFARHHPPSARLANPGWRYGTQSDSTGLWLGVQDSNLFIALVHIYSPGSSHS